MIGAEHATIQLSPLPLSPRIHSILRLARAISKRAGAESVGSDHLLIAILLEKDSLGSEILRRLKVTQKKIDRIRRKLDKAEYLRRSRQMSSINRAMMSLASSSSMSASVNADSMPLAPSGKLS